MSLNIKNEQTHALARELAEITGESITGAVTVAVRERLDRLRQRSRKGMVTCPRILIHS
jgi:antitoxin VapB